MSDVSRGSPPRNGGLEIVERREMLSGRLRVDYVRARDVASSREVVWHSLSAETARGPVTFTIRGRELRPVAAALLRAAAGSLPEELREPARSIIHALEGRR